MQNIAIAKKHHFFIKNPIVYKFMLKLLKHILHEILLVLIEQIRECSEKNETGQEMCY